MASALNPLLLMRLARGRRAPRSPDPADMGTAFGLDYILDEAAKDMAAPEVVASAWASTDWFRRWLPAKPER